MLKRLSSFFIAVTLTAATIAPAAVHAQATPTNQNTPNQSVSNLISSGLWAGVNFIFGSPATTPASRPANQTTPAPSPAPVPATPPATAQSYVALGDSVAAGVGLPTPSAVPSNQTGCGRTAEAYPAQVARGAGLPLIHAACSGATVRDLYTTQYSNLSFLPQQLDTAFRGGTPRMITITAGANDMLWEEFLRTCASSLNCANSASTELANSRLRTVQARYVYALDQIKTRSRNRPPTVVVTGYYNPVSPACTTVRPTVTAEEVRWMTGAVNALNQTIRQVSANYNFVRFAPVDFTGHDICSSQPWIQGLADRRPIHPTVQGQRVIARSVLGATGK